MPSHPAVPIQWPDPSRAAAFDAWISIVASNHGLVRDSVRLASADASFRRYFRVTCSGKTFDRIIMDAPPAREETEPFVRIAGLMADAGIPAPRILEWDQGNGFLLLDDLGEKTMLDALAEQSAQGARSMYQRAISILVAWQSSSRAGVLPAYDRTTLERELALFPEWYIAKHRGIHVDGKLQARLEGCFSRIVDSNLSTAKVYVHRDFMPRNLMVCEMSRLGVLDFQDALHGPITYDIASLMRDAFHSWDDDFVREMTAHYWLSARDAGLPVDSDFESFFKDVEWMGLQRHLKVAGIFARLTLRDGKPNYLADAPRFIRYIRATCSRYPDLHPLLQIVDYVEGSAMHGGAL